MKWKKGEKQNSCLESGIAIFLANEWHKKRTEKLQKSDAVERTRVQLICFGLAAQP